ncbi:hypothetical protein JJ685_12065 [Ramlibacter monticola]|uniref:Uncharacterized protein n=1 Tax=Ramlibacter monticola TaxID=1926872 RepID=A0A936YYJ8_9BURK|nr:hypothetical protein [Ramlibacter monticola]MBL0391865.1 hypothetical protein [Ramlibacter monticola]
MRANEHASLLEALSERLLADYTQELWRKVFLGPGYERIRFERETVTFLCTDTLDFDWTPEEIGRTAARHDGRVERCDQRCVLVFARARDALQMALLLQRSSSYSLRMTLLTTDSTSAVFEHEDGERRLAIGPEAREAGDSAERLPPGSIHISAETCQSLGPSSSWQPRAARLASALQGDTAVTLALSPRRAAMGACAELGLA